MLFNRRYRLLVGKRAQQQGLLIEHLRIQFEIHKTTKKNPNSSKIQIWNLAKGTRTEIEKQDNRCLLYAGYEEDMGPLLIFSGGVTYAWTKKDGPDIITEFELGDGAQEIRDSVSTHGYGPGIDSNTILQDVAKEMGLPLVIPSNASNRSWENGLSYYGNSRGLLDKVTKGSGQEWSIQNGNLQVIPTGGVTTRQGIVLRSDSGMIGTPERQRKTSKDKKEKSTEPEKQPDGWKLKSLLMPTLNPGDRVIVESETLEGIYRIEELKHFGDSHEGDWMTELLVIDADQPLSGATGVESKGGQPKRGKKGKKAKAGPAGILPGDW